MKDNSLLVSISWWGEGVTPQCDLYHMCGTYGGVTCIYICVKAHRAVCVHIDTYTCTNSKFHLR